ncbi:MAG: DUF1835 domain-containing protein [Gemmatimonadota bacterium]
MLHITNGDSAAGLILQGGIGGEILPWRDVLHEGPVPGGLELEAVSRVRSRFIADVGWGSESEVVASFERRDARLREVGREEEVVLWFEADLYDQLQLIQLLDYFHRHPPRSLSLICIAGHPAVPRFLGLGQLTPEQMAGLFPIRQPVTPAHLELAHRAWLAFTASEPAGLNEFLQRDSTTLPYLAPALVRLLEEYPSVEDGTSRTERQLLIAVANGADTFEQVFRATQEMEFRSFMGDLTLWTRIGDLARPPAPALHMQVAELRDPGPLGNGFTLRLTPLGRTYLDQTADLVAGHGIERWIGGVHLSGHRVSWRWDRERNALISF